MFGGKFYPYHAYGINEKQSNHGLEKFFLQAGIDVLTGVQAAQTVAAIITTPETGGGSDALDVIAIGAENGVKDAAKAEIDKLAAEEGAAEVAENESNAIETQSFYNNGQPLPRNTIVNKTNIVRALSPKGMPNSSAQLYDNGELMQIRYYDSEGKAMEDVDYAHSNGDNSHSFPHNHIWDWSGSKPIRK